MPVVNSGYEIAGASAGQAASWTWAHSSARTDFAAYNAGARGYEDFSQNWFLPVGQPTQLALGTWNVATDAFVDGGAFATDAQTRPRLVVDVPAGGVAGGVTLNITYTDPVAGAGRAATVVIPAGLAGVFPATLAAGDVGALDVTAVAEAAPVGAGPVLTLRGLRGLTWLEGLSYPIETWRTDGNENALFAYLPAHLAAALYFGITHESFSRGWSGLDGTLRDTWAALASTPFSFDARPALPGGLLAENVEDFAEGWGSPRARTIVLGTYRVADNLLTISSPQATGDPITGSYPQTVAPRVRITSAFGALDQDFDILYRRFAGDGITFAARVRVPALAQVGQLCTLQIPPSAAAPAAEHRREYGIAELVAPVTETPATAGAGEFAIEVTQIPDEADPLAFNLGTLLSRMHMQLIAGAGTARLHFHATSLGTIAPAPTVALVAPGVGVVQAATTVSRVGNAFTITLRNQARAAGAVPVYPGTAATAQEVVDALRATTTFIYAEAGGNLDPVLALPATAFTLDVNVTAADYDPLAGTRTFEDFTYRWAGAAASLTLQTGFAIPVVAGTTTALLDLGVALYNGGTTLGTYNAATNIYTDGSVMPVGTSFNPLVVDVTTPFTISAGTPRLNYQGLATVGGAFDFTPVNNGLTNSGLGASILVPLPVTHDQGTNLSLVRETDLAGVPADQFSTGLATVRGGATRETFATGADTTRGWVLLLT